METLTPAQAQAFIDALAAQRNAAHNDNARLMIQIADRDRRIAELEAKVAELEKVEKASASKNAE